MSIHSTGIGNRPKVTRPDEKCSSDEEGFVNDVTRIFGESTGVTRAEAKSVKLDPNEIASRRFRGRYDQHERQIRSNGPTQHQKRDDVKKHEKLMMRENESNGERLDSLGAPREQGRCCDCFETVDSVPFLPAVAVPNRRVPKYLVQYMQPQPCTCMIGSLHHQHKNIQIQAVLMGTLGLSLFCFAGYDVGCRCRCKRCSTELQRQHKGH